MNQQILARRRCLGTAVAISLALSVAGCSEGTSDPVTKSSPSVAVETTDPAATAALAKALRVTKALRSYSFSATQRLTGGPAPQVTSLQGRAVRPASISYDLAVGGKVSQVIKIGSRSYARVPPGTWQLLTKPSPAVDPLVSLVALLNGLTAPKLVGAQLTGTASPAALSKAGLAPSGARSSGSVPVAMTLDAAGRVTAVALRVPVRAGSTTIVVDGRTTFGQFNVAPAIKAPGTTTK